MNSYRNSSALITRAMHYGFHDSSEVYWNIPSVTRWWNAVSVFTLRMKGKLHKLSTRNYKQVSILLFTCWSSVRLRPSVLRDKQASNSPEVWSIGGMTSDRVNHSAWRDTCGTAGTGPGPLQSDACKFHLDLQHNHKEAWNVRLAPELRVMHMFICITTSPSALTNIAPGCSRFSSATPVSTSPSPSSLQPTPHSSTCHT
jgi:hypothetical protein